MNQQGSAHQTTTKKYFARTPVPHHRYSRPQAPKPSLTLPNRLTHKPTQAPSDRFFLPTQQPTTQSLRKFLRGTETPVPSTVLTYAKPTQPTQQYTARILMLLRYHPRVPYDSVGSKPLQYAAALNTQRTFFSYAPDLHIYRRLSIFICKLLH